ncbi:MAG: SDR family oxidoreductase, partial [Pirellulaceae bacterium]|nr:SDR family oxidoreductase [Pirellulaceae bacterium]
MSVEFLKDMFGLDGQTAVVVGGTGVLGGAIAEGLAKAGAYVVVAGRSEERGYKCVDVIRGCGGEAGFLPVDVFSKESVQELLDKTLDERGQVDMLVNCAGINSATPFEEITLEEFHRILDGNLTATLYGCQVFAAHMTKQDHGGSILNIGSVTS